MVHLGVHPVSFMLALKNNKWSELTAMTSGGGENNMVHQKMEGEDWAGAFMRFKDGTFATMVHIPACSTPRVLVGSGNGRSEGYIVHVYESYIILEGYEFVQGETFAYATYIIEK